MPLQKSAAEAEQPPANNFCGTRRSDRVELSMPIEAIGIDLNRGRPFCEKGKTTTVSRHGAAIVLNYALATDQELAIRCLGNNREAAVRVVGLIAGEGKELIYGVAFLNPESNPWEIEFPTLIGAADTVGRTLLQCSSCQANEVVHLNEIEIEVIEANRRIQRFCKGCAATTSWKQTVTDSPSHAVLGGHKLAAKASVRQSSQEKRRHNRIKTAVSACIRQSGFPDEIVTCENLSRGGLRFRSSRLYSRGSRVQVSVPHSPGNGNIFVPSYIVHVEECDGFFRIGAAYLGGSDLDKGRNL